MDLEQRNKFAKAHMDIVDKIVGSMIRRLGSRVEKNDIRSSALGGFALAIDRFDPNLGIPFAAFAIPRIRGAIYDDLIKSSWLPRRLIREISFYKKADELLRYSAPFEPPADVVESAHQMADRLKELATTWITVCAVPDDKIIIDDDECRNSEYILARKQYLLRALHHIENMPKKHRILIKKYFFEGKTLEDIGQGMGHTKSWASRIITSSLKIIRTKLEEDFEGKI